MIADNIFQESSAAPAGAVLTSNGSFARPSFQTPTSFTVGVTALTGSTDAIPVAPGVIRVASSGVDAMTLATPTAGAPGVGDDGKQIWVYDAGGHVHTITTAANKITPSHDTLTFNGTAGSYVHLLADNGLWLVLGSSGVTASEV